MQVVEEHEAQPASDHCPQGKVEDGVYLGF